MFEKLTILILGHFSFIKEPLSSLKLLLHSLPEELKKSRFIFVYDESNFDGCTPEKIKDFEEFISESGLDYEIFYSNYGLYHSVGIGLDNVKTEYFLFLEDAMIFLIINFRVT